MSSDSGQLRRLCFRTLLVFGSISLLVFGGFVLWVSIALHVDCANDNLRERISPGGQLKAVTFRRNCGATTPYSTQVSILPASRNLPNEAGNVFTVDHEHSIDVRWIDDHHLNISGETITQFLHLNEFNGVQITYN